MFKKEVCLFQLDYMINCIQNENDNAKIDHINKAKTDLDIDIETKNIQNILCVGKECVTYRFSYALRHYDAQGWGVVG